MSSLFNRHLLLAVLALTGFTIHSFADPGIGSAEGLSIPANATSFSMAQSGVAYLSGADAVLINPSRMGQLAYPSMSLSHLLYLDGIKFTQVGYVYPINQTFAVGGAGSILSYGSIDNSDDSGVVHGQFEPNDKVFSLGVSSVRPFAALGINLKYISSEIISKTTTLTTDLGLSKKINDKVNLGVSASNLFGSLKYDSASNQLTKIYRLGVDLKANKNTRFEIDQNLMSGSVPATIFGAEKTLELGMRNLKLIQLRGGYNTRMAKDKSFVSGLTLGLGFSLEKLDVNYAFLMMGDMGINQFITFNYYFLDQEVSDGVVFKKRAHRRYQKSDGPFKSKRIRNIPQSSKEKGVLPEDLKMENDSTRGKTGKNKDKKNRLYDTLIKKK